MSNIAVVSQIWDNEKKDWLEPELLSTHPLDDDVPAAVEAAEEAADRLNTLIVEKEKPAKERELEFPWVERIMVCPILPGLGAGGGDQYAIEDRTFCATVGLE
jgi:hypothetical protein